MKILFCILATLSLQLACAEPEPAEKPPALDLAQAFPNEEPLSKVNMEKVQIYSYMMDHDFADLQKKLEAFLGKPWVLSKDKEAIAEAIKGAEKTLANAGMKVQGLAIYQHPDQPLSSITLMQTSMPEGGLADGNQMMVSLTYMNL